MAWTSATATQDGNTELPYVISGGALTNHDAVVTKLLVAPSPTTKIGITQLQQSINPNKYYARVRVVGQGPVKFALAAEAMD